MPFSTSVNDGNLLVLINDDISERGTIDSIVNRYENV